MAKPGPKPGSKRKSAQQETVAPTPAPVAEAPSILETSSTPVSETSADSADDVAGITPATDLPEQAPQRSAQPDPEPDHKFSASDRENPGKLSGQALRDLAHRRGIALSTLCFMSDEKIREQLLYINYRQYEDAVD